MAKVGVILSGCGVQDGGEIHESVITLLALDRMGAQMVCMAPNKELDEMNHLTGRPTGTRRNVLVEAARIARGNIKDVKGVKSMDIDAVILPGGFGAAKNLSTFAKDGKDCKVDEGVAKLLRDMHSFNKPIGAICIAPAVIAKVFGADIHPELTIGTDAGTAKVLEDMGAKHINCKVTDVVVDKKNKIVTTPAYMLATRISEAATGIEKLVKEVLALVK